MAIKRNKRVGVLRDLSKIFYWFSRVILFVPNKIGRFLGHDDLVCNLVMPFSQALEAESNVYMTYNFMPKNAMNLTERVNYHSNILNEVAIVMRGLVEEKYNFSLETVRLYKKIYPGVLVVLSIWDDVDPVLIKEFEKEDNCVVQLNKIPDKAGNGNSYYQQVTKVGGINRAKKENRKYVFETRSDIRINQPGIIEQLVEYIDKYPIKQQDKNIGLESRIVLFNAFLIEPCHQTDFFTFGLAKDLLEVFDSPFWDDEVEGKSKVEHLNGIVTYRQMFEHPFGELYALTQFLKRKIELKCSIEQWWDVISKYFICCQANMLYPLWYKYDYNHEQSNFLMSYRRKILGGADIRTTTITFAMWLDMYNGRFGLNPNDYELWLDKVL